MIDEAPRSAPARRGCSVSYRGKALLSLVDPIAQAERIAAAAPIHPKTLYLCFSPLYGYGLSSLLERITADSAVLCIEAEEPLMELSLKEFPAELAGDPRLRLARTADAAAACAFVRKEFGPRRFRRVVPLRMSGGWALRSRTYEDIERTVRADIAIDWSNAMTLVRLGRRYALNAVRNLALLPSSASLDAASFGDAPILVLGAGPSLDAASPLLAPDRAYRIVCVDTALLPLRERGVAPDLVVALEAQQWNLRDFIGTAASAIPIATDLSSLPAGARATGGPRYLFSVPWTPLRFFDRLAAAGLLPPAIPPLGSVGLAAVSVALRAGTGPVVVAGLDFSYGIGTYHARSAPSRVDRLCGTCRTSSLIDPAAAFRPGVVRASGKAGAPVRTDPALRSYRDLFHREFGDRERLLDAGSGGLDLGIQRITMEEAAGILGSAGGPRGGAPERGPMADAERVARFIDGELERLDELRSLLTGGGSGADLRRILADCDYLWAHFPEYAGAEDAAPDADNLAVLKRIRAEIDPFRKAFSIARSELSR